MSHRGLVVTVVGGIVLALYPPRPPTTAPTQCST